MMLARNTVHALLQLFLSCLLTFLCILLLTFFLLESYDVSLYLFKTNKCFLLYVIVSASNSHIFSLLLHGFVRCELSFPGTFLSIQRLTQFFDKHKMDGLNLHRTSIFSYTGSTQNVTKSTREYAMHLV
jgi:hypothetical protein